MSFNAAQTVQHLDAAKAAVLEINEAILSAKATAAKYHKPANEIAAIETRLAVATAAFEREQQNMVERAAALRADLASITEKHAAAASDLAEVEAKLAAGRADLEKLRADLA